MTKKEYNNFKIGDTIWYAEDFDMHTKFVSSIVEVKKQVQSMFGLRDAFLISSSHPSAQLVIPRWMPREKCFLTLKEAKIDHIKSTKNFRDIWLFWR